MRGFIIGVVVVCAAIVLAACSGSDSTGPSSTGVSGNWKFQELLSASGIGLTCADSAAITLTQTGQTFTGTYNQTGVCSANGQSGPNDGTGNITNGRVSGDSVVFNEDNCAYTGTFKGSPATSMTGTVSCPDSSTGTLLNIGGTWVMNR